MTSLVNSVVDDASEEMNKIGKENVEIHAFLRGLMGTVSTEVLSSRKRRGGETGESQPLRDRTLSV